MGHNKLMKYELQSTQSFNHWLAKLKDRPVKNQLLSRLARIENGNFGDTKTLSAGLYELRCFFGGGIRIYYTIRNQRIILLLVGGDKSSQNRDIEKAKTILDALED
jgi:putative addiction module killer protein